MDYNKEQIISNIKEITEKCINTGLRNKLKEYTIPCMREYQLRFNPTADNRNLPWAYLVNEINNNDKITTELQDFIDSYIREANQCYKDNNLKENLNLKEFKLNKNIKNKLLDIISWYSFEYFYNDYEESENEKILNNIESKITTNNDLNDLEKNFLNEIINSYLSDMNHNHKISKEFKNYIKKLNESKLFEASRNELLAQTKEQTISRYKRSEEYKGFYIYDIDTSNLFTKQSPMLITCRVGKYHTQVEIQDVLLWVQLRAEEDPNKQINTKNVNKALSDSIDGMDIKVNCECGDFVYRFAYMATQLGYKYGQPENRPAKIRNPHDYGALCFEGNTLVLTEQGLKPIKDIKVGDRVFTHRGRLREVLANSHHYEDKLIKSHIGTEDIICTENHPFYIMNKKEKNPEWKSLKECKWKNEVVLSPKLQLNEEITLPKGYAFMLGLFLSDGHIDIRSQKDETLYPNQLTIALDKQYKQKYIDKMNELNINNFRFKEETYGYNTNCINLQIYDSELKKFIVEKGGYTYKDKHSKYLSEECFNWSKSDKLDLINGFFWGDGQFGATGKKDGYLQYVLYNSNKDIMQKLYILIRSFTYAKIFSMTKKPFFSKRMKKIITPRKHYLITVRGEHIKDILQKDTHFVKTEYSFSHPISLYKKSSDYLENIEYYKTDICLNKISDTEGAEVYNLQVADDESYLITRELYAVHNCKHLTAMLSNKKWIQQVTSTLMDFIVKNIDKVNEFLRLEGDEQLTLPNELARRMAKKGFYTKFANRNEVLQEIANNYIKDIKDKLFDVDLNLDDDLQRYIDINYKVQKIQPNEFKVIRTLINNYIEKNKPKESEEDIEDEEN